ARPSRGTAWWRSAAGCRWAGWTRRARSRSACGSSTRACASTVAAAWTWSGTAGGRAARRTRAGELLAVERRPRRRRLGVDALRERDAGDEHRGAGRVPARLEDAARGARQRPVVHRDREVARGKEVGRLPVARAEPQPRRVGDHVLAVLDARE